MAPEIVIRDEPGMARFTAELSGSVAWVSYEANGDAVRFTRTEIPEALAGRGVATQLARVALAEARMRGWVVEPCCELLLDYMRAHPETHDLLSPEGWQMLRR